MAGIPLVVETSEWKQFRCIYIKKKYFLSIFFCVFRICIKFRTFSKKDVPHSLCISEITNHETGAWITV